MTAYREYLETHARLYQRELLDDTLPFWLEHGVDAEHGGVWTALDRNGKLLDSDKSMWFQGRFAWLLSTLYLDVERNPVWLKAAESTVDFLLRHGFDESGKMYFLVTADGRPLRQRRYLFTEMFAAMALAAFGRAADRIEHRERAAQVFEQAMQRLLDGQLPEKWISQTRATKSFSTPMIVLNTAQVLRQMLQDNRYQQWVDWAIEEMRPFICEEHRAVLEQVSGDGELIDHYDGRVLNPGHAIEGAWFILQEAKRRGGNNPELIQLGTKMLDWMWHWGWDSSYGGIIYYRDVLGKPMQEYWHDMKFWWPQNETVIATLLAYQLTGDPLYLDWHQQVHEWAYRHFPDPEHGEWYGYLHRDGRLSHHAKGTLWKGPFHLPRMLWMSWRICEEVLAQTAGEGHQTGE